MRSKIGNLVEFYKIPTGNISSIEDRYSMQGFNQTSGYFIGH